MGPGEERVFTLAMTLSFEDAYGLDYVECQGRVRFTSAAGDSMWFGCLREAGHLL